MKTWNIYFADTDNIVRVVMYEGVTKHEAAWDFTKDWDDSEVDVSRILKVEPVSVDWEV
jgi:hypothetical protein